MDLVANDVSRFIRDLEFLIDWNPTVYTTHRTKLWYLFSFELSETLSNIRFIQSIYVVIDLIEGGLKIIIFLLNFDRFSLFPPLSQVLYLYKFIYVSISISSVIPFTKYLQNTCLIKHTFCVIVTK